MGSPLFFWKDFWTNGQKLCEQFPRLFSFTLNEDVTVSDLALPTDLSSYFALPLSVEAHEEYMQIQQILHSARFLGYVRRLVEPTRCSLRYHFIIYVRSKFTRRSLNYLIARVGIAFVSNNLIQLV
jgi:hypothetical protein